MDLSVTIAMLNSPSAARIRDSLPATTPPSSSSNNSIHSSPIAHLPGSDFESSKSSSTNQPKAPSQGGASEESESKPPGSITVNAPGASLLPVTRGNVSASIGSSKGSDLMAKWLPSSTSCLAEPLEQDTSSRAESAHSNHESSHSTALMTPPFTPLKRSEQAHSQIRAADKIHPRSLFMTPPSTIKHEQINHNRPRSPYSGLSPALRVPSRTSARANSSNSQHHTPYPMDSLTQQMNKLSPLESLRPRSLSSPMEPSFDAVDPALNRLPVPRSDPVTSLQSGLSSEEEVAEFRKRADTFCSSSSTPFHPLISDVNSPAASSLLRQHAVEASPVKLGCAGQHAASLTSFAPNPSNVYTGMPSALAFAKSGSHFGPAGHRSDDPATLLFPSARHGPDFPMNNSKPSLASQASLIGASSGANSGSERHQRYHTAPAESSPLSQVVRPILPLSRNGNLIAGTPNAGRRVEERSMSLAGPSQAELLQPSFIHARFRPRSSTVADTTGKKLLGKSLLSVNWEDGELVKEPQEEVAKSCTWSSGSAQNDGPTRSSIKGLNFPWNNVLPETDSKTFPGSFSLYPGSVSRPPLWGASSIAGATRYCKVLGVSPKLLGSMKGIVRVRNAFAEFGDLLDIHVDTLSPVGFILVGFHDSRSIFNMIQTGIKTLESNFGSYLKMEPLQRNEVVQLTQDLDNPVLSSNEGALSLQFEDPRGIITEEVLIEYLQRYGDLRALRSLGPALWSSEWYDDRQAVAAQKELMARDFADFQVKVDVPEPDLHSILEGQYPGVMARSLGGLGSNVCLLPPTIRPPAMASPADSYNNNLLYRCVGDPYTANYMFPWTQPLPVPPPSPLYNFHAPASLPVDSLGCVTSATISPDMFGSSAKFDHQSSPQSPMSNRPRAFPFPGVPPSNVMDLDRIECGSDPRTTCMIKNIPNKITDEMLFNFINEVCPRGFDFLYLRMDFKARLNVGYAFINFLCVENVLKFAKAKLGVKWGVFLSEKTVQMCYASIQGKENLIEKFRNSAIMEEEESFRPKVYHSSGPLIGLPEPFPHANDLQRKARSQANAALLVRPPVSTTNSIHP